MKNKAESITKYQLFFMILQTQIGVGVLSLPFSVHQISKGDGWISVLIAGLAVQLLITLIWLLVKRYPGESVFGIAEQVAGPFFGKIIGYSYIIYGLMVATLILLLYQDILKLWVLPNTPVWVVYVLMLGASSYLVRERVRIIARFYQFVTFLLPFLLILTIISFPENAEIRYIFPIGQSGFKMFVGAHAVLISMLGFEMLLLLNKYVEADEKTIFKTVSFANLATTLLYTFMTFISFVVFSPKEIEIVPQPVLYMLKAITFRIVERIDLIFISIWIVIVATSLMSYILLASKGVAFYLKQTEHQQALYILAPIAFMLALFPQSKYEIEQIGTYVGYISYIFVAILPTCLLLISIIKSRRYKRSAGR